MLNLGVALYLMMTVRILCLVELIKTFSSNIVNLSLLKYAFAGSPIQDVKNQPDFCINEPCMRHGTCENGPTTYTCICAPRYTGKNCEIDNGNPCGKKNPCKNGATCVDDNSGSYTCNCLMGYTGKSFL